MQKLYNVEAERCIIGSIMLENSCLLECQNQGLQPYDFYIRKNQIIYKYMQNFFRECKKIDLIDLTNDIEKHGEIDDGMLLSYILESINLVPTYDNVDYYAKIVKDYSIKRDLMAAFQRQSNSIQSATISDMLEFCNEISNTLLNTGHVSNLFISASDIAYKTEQIPSISTGFEELDSSCGNGFAQGTLTVLTGSPGSGKSTLVNQIIAQAISTGTNCFLYSGELTYQMLMNWFARTVANKSDLIESSSYLGKFYNISQECWQSISNWVNGKFYIYSKEAQADEKNLNSTIEYLAVKKDVKLFVLDNLMTLEFSGNDKYEKQISAVKAIKSLAKKYDLVIILIAHPNKSAVFNREPHVFEISGASEVPNMADYVLKITRGDGDSSEIMLMKNRITGVQGKKIKLGFSPKRKRFFSQNMDELERDYGYRAQEIISFPTK